MNSLGLLTIIARLAGLFLCLASLQLLLPLVASMLFPGQPQQAITNTVVSFLLLSAFWFALSCFMIVKPDLFARAVMPKSLDAKDINTNLTFDEWQTIAFSAVGAYLLVTSLSHVAGWIPSLVTARDSTETIRLLASPFTILYLIQLLASFWLLIGARGLRRLLRVLRHRGTG